MGASSALQSFVAVTAGHFVPHSQEVEDGQVCRAGFMGVVFYAIILLCINQWVKSQG